MELMRAAIGRHAGAAVFAGVGERSREGHELLAEAKAAGIDKRAAFVFGVSAVEVLRDMIPPASLAGVHIWFPDPWHKKKHHKRRLVQPAFVATLLQHVRPGGYLHCATDWEPYAAQMLEVLSAEPGLANTAEGYAPRPEWRPLTKFENRGLRLGHGVWDLVYQKR
jgi:tRNA (guanine-N7-)-methyltransferase